MIVRQFCQGATVASITRREVIRGNDNSRGNRARCRPLRDLGKGLAGAQSDETKCRDKIFHFLNLLTGKTRPERMIAIHQGTIFSTKAASTKKFPGHH
jgi:hypothetical protein